MAAYYIVVYDGSNRHDGRAAKTASQMGGPAEIVEAFREALPHLEANPEAFLVVRKHTQRDRIVKTTEPRLGERGGVSEEEV